MQTRVIPSPRFRHVSLVASPNTPSPVPLFVQIDPTGPGLSMPRQSNTILLI